MPLPLTVSCSNKIQIGFTFLVLAHPGSPGLRAIKRLCVTFWNAQPTCLWMTGQQKLLLYCTHAHTFNGPLSRTTQVSQYQKGKTNLDFTEARDSEWQWHQLGHMQICISLQTNNQLTMHPTTQFFYRPDALPAAQPTVSKHWRNILYCIVLHCNILWNPITSNTFGDVVRSIPS